MTIATENSDKSFRLSPEQINTFQTFGFMRFPGLFNDDIQRYAQLFDELFEQEKKDVIGWMHDGHYNKERKVLAQFIERTDSFASIIDDPRIDSIFSSLLGSDYLYRASDGNIFSGDTYWHTDLYNMDFRYQHLKMLFYLEPVDADSGCLRVLPGSHHWGDKYAKMLERDTYEPEKNYDLSAVDIPGFSIPTQPGDVILFDFRLKHAACNASEPRRMFTVCASERFKDEHLPDLTKSVSALLDISGKVYQDAIIDSADKKRMKHLEQYLLCEELLKQQSSAAD